MQIIINNSIFSPKDFLFNIPNIVGIGASQKFAIQFLNQWISGKKTFEFKTSGSTGNPKTIILTKKQFEYSSLQTINSLSLWDDKILCCIPSSKIGGAMCIIRALAGSFDICINEPKSNPMLDIEINHDFTFVSLVPIQISKICEHQESIDKINRFKHVFIGGNVISNVQLEFIKNLKPNIYHTYGMTETCSNVALKKLNHEAWPYFKFEKNIEFSINNDNTLNIKAVQTNNEWLKTNDIVNVISKNEFEILGRSDFVINRNGIKIIPETLENKILQYIDFKFYISSIKSEYLGEDLILITNESDMIYEKLAPILILLDIKITNFKWNEILEMNTNGKIIRKKY